ncbi:glycosyltransferase family 9 protein [Isosphaeraceae bacterium EP7]
MIRSALEPRPVVLGRYRYSKWRWRILVRAFDAAGSMALRGWRTVRPAPIAPEPRRILVVQLDHMGDAVLSSPMFPRLKAAFPGATIDVLASPSNREVFEADPHVDRVLLAERNWFERRRGHWSLGQAVWTLGRSLRGEKYDLGIDVRGDILTVLVLTLAGIPRRAGWAMGGGGFLLTDVADWVPGRHEVRSRLALLDAIGIAVDDPARVHVYPSDTDRARVARMLNETWSGGSRRSALSRGLAQVGRTARVLAGVGRRDDGASYRDDEVDLDADSLHAGRFGEPSPLLAVHVGAGTAAKRWPRRYWAALVARFLDEGWRVVVIGGPDDTETAEAMEPHDLLADWVGRMSLTETSALLERADLFIGTDSGPAHLAACAGVPSVVLFSGTNRHAQWRPWSRRTLVLRKRTGCGPCHQKVCPVPGHPCMSRLTPDRVHRAACRWWSRLHRSESPHAPV